MQYFGVLYGTKTTYSTNLIKVNLHPLSFLQTHWCPSIYLNKQYISQSSSKDGYLYYIVHTQMVLFKGEGNFRIKKIICFKLATIICYTFQFSPTLYLYPIIMFKGIEHVPNIFMSFDQYLFLKVINILI